MKKLLLLIALLSTIFTACSNSDEATPTFSGCLVKTVKAKSGPLVGEAVFTYNNQGDPTQITNGFFSTNIVYENNKVTIPGFSNLSKDEMYLDNGKWVRSIQTYGSIFNGIVLNGYTTITPIYSGDIITKIRAIRSEDELVNGVKKLFVLDSVIISLSYNASGNLVSLTDSSPGFYVAYTFDYPDSLAAVKSNNYLNLTQIDKMKILGLQLPLITGKFKPFKNLPAQINTVNNRKSILKLFGVQSDANNNITKLIIDPEENFGIGQSDTIDLSYECR
jgi:hypothetical protein